MNLYLIDRIGHVGYDEFDGFVIAAESETEARSLCNQADEGDIWGNQLDATCELIGTAKDGTNKGVILESFNAG